MSSPKDGTHFQEESSVIFEDLIDSIIVDVASECHRIARLGLDHNLDHEEEELRLSAQALVQVSDPRTSGDSKKMVDIFGQTHPAIAGEVLDCMKCGRSIAAGRFAPHLEKCMGKGRNAARTKATRSSTKTQNANTNETAGAGEQNPVFVEDPWNMS